MRTWTLFVSVSAHAAVIGAIIVAPLFAVGELPEPRRAATMRSITPIELPTAPVTVRQVRTQTLARPRTVPLTEPIGVHTEVPLLEVPPRSVVDWGVPSGNGFPPGDAISASDAAPAPPPPPPPVAPLRVSGLVQPKRVTYVAPVYPPLALASHVQGTVILEAVIDERGAVREVRVLRSIRLLDDAAVNAVGQWRFTPTLLNGQPVPVVMTVTVGFRLTK